MSFQDSWCRLSFSSSIFSWQSFHVFPAISFGTTEDRCDTGGRALAVVGVPRGCGEVYSGTGSQYLCLENGDNSFHMELGRVKEIVYVLSMALKNS